MKPVAYLMEDLRKRTNSWFAHLPGTEAGFHMKAQMTNYYDVVRADLVLSRKMPLWQLPSFYR